MRSLTRKTTAAGAAAFVLAGSAALAGSSGTASADTSTVQCGQTVTAKPGDTIKTPFGPRTVTDGITSLVGGLLGGLCKITVTVVDTVVAPVPVVGQTTAGVVDNTVAGTTNTVTKAAAKAGDTVSGKSQTPPARTPPGGGAPQSPGSGTPARGGTPATMPSSNSPASGDSSPTLATLPFGSNGSAPMADYSGIPYTLAALWAPSPGIRYGGEIPGYAPEASTLDAQENSRATQRVGDAQALPGPAGSGGLPLELPMVGAVLALSGVTGALVRRWVLRGTH
ncbi:MAG TPA: hypothetical protein VJT49_09205 [Amycolatopsis sp.]|uniref:hypothetical protein n=1 Tax=Amycolatopsis sp. TaxID=37632 RepID=UPI002B473D43|nr:hypothetical protein [Amycolatopsis sp.]HKS45278.1 hypothetical protein [Amycolatopsis sp.]